MSHARPRRDPTDEWAQLCLLVTSPEQEPYENLRPIVLFGQPTSVRAQETGTAEHTLRRAVARFESGGMRSLFDPEPPPSADRRLLPTRIRVGRGLAEDGAVTAGWGPWLPVSGWVQWENRGGCCLRRPGSGRQSGPGRLRDRRPGGAQRRVLRVGLNLNVNGLPAAGWSPWISVAAWGSWEDAGSGAARAAYLGEDRPRLVAFHVYERPGENAGLYWVEPLRLLPDDSEVLPVHAALLRTGNVLFFAGSGNSVVRFTSPRFGDVAAGVYTSVVWDVA